MAIKTLEEAIAEAELTPVSWAQCWCRKCGEFRTGFPLMESKRMLLPCPTCDKLIWATEQGRGGTKKQPRIEDEAVFKQISFACEDSSARQGNGPLGNLGNEVYQRAVRSVSGDSPSNYERLQMW